MDTPAPRRYTAKDLESMPDDRNRYELVNGELLVTPNPGGLHQFIAGRLCGRLYAYLDGHGLRDWIGIARFDVVFGPDTVLEPDLFVADIAAAVRSGSPPDASQLYLAIEIISPSSARNDRGVKRQVYQSNGIPEYWVVDGDAECVELWTPDAIQPRIEREHLIWRHPALDVSCEIDLVRLFDFG